MKERREMPPGLRRAYVLVLAPAAALAPLALLWTEGASRAAILVYELTLASLWWRARNGRPARLSDAAQNVAGALYLAWIAFETLKLHAGLLRSVSHLLLFTALAKIASLKRPSEARLALLVCFLLTLASASSSTHVSSLLYLAAVAWVGFRALSLLAVLADFDEAPPERVLGAVPTAGLTAVAIVGGLVLTAPLFVALPRLRGPFAVAPFHVEDAFSKALASDRVDLESFGAAKRSDRVVLRLSAVPDLPEQGGLRLREAVFTEYQEGSWIRNPWLGTRRGERSAFADPPEAGRRPAAVVSVDLNVFGQGFLFLPYGTSAVRVDKGRAVELPDGILQASSGRGLIRYEADVRRGAARGPGRGSISPADVPEAVQKYALELTRDLTDPRAIYKRVEGIFRKGFVYTLDVPRATGDPIAHFLLRSKAGHCEYFASRGIPARLVTGSFGGEEGLFSKTIVVRAQNLHAWVEADLDGAGFQVLDPTPPAGIPPALRAFSILSRVAALGREIEFFYDRRVLGFDAGDQAGVVEAVRESMGTAAGVFAALKSSAGDLFSSGAVAGLLAVGLLAWWIAQALWRLRSGPPPTTRAYLELRRLLARRSGPVAPSTPPAEVARLFTRAVPEGRDDARAVVSVYCASTFGGIRPDPATLRELSERVRRLRKLA